MTVFISVVVPVYNDKHGIATTLSALVCQKFSGDMYEVIISDNGSTDGTREVVGRFQRAHPSVIRLVVENERKGSYAARNKGVRSAKGEIVAFIDANMWVDDNWLSQIAIKMDEQEIDYLGCRVQICRVRGPFIGHYNAVFGFPVEKYIAEGHFAPTCCLVVRRDVFARVGLFDARLLSSGDWLFGQLVYKSGIEQHFADEITLYHPARGSLYAFAAKYFRIGRGHYQLRKYYPPALRAMSLSVSSFLPVRPAAYLQSVESRSEEKGLRWVEIVGFYAVSCFERWVRTLGYVYEAVLTLLRSGSLTLL